MTRQQGLSKTRIITHRQCPRRLWLQAYRPELAEVSEKVQAIMATGHKIGEVARDLFPDGVLIATDDLVQAQQETVALLGQRPRPPIFEATFSQQRVLIRADILAPYGNGYKMAEVKSVCRVKEYHYEDAAVQAWVIRQSGVRIHRVEICHLNRDYCYPGGSDLQGLLTFSDITPETRELQAAVPGWIKSARSTLALDQPPTTKTGDQCCQPYSCPFLTYCAPETITERKPTDLDVLPYASKLVASLRSEGYGSVKKVPATRLTNPVHSRIRRCLQKNQAELDPAAGELLRTFSYPRHYLDFETMQFAVPVWAGTAPLAQVPFQWSCHREKSPGGKLQAFSFLADGRTSPCRELTENLLAVLGDRGSIFVYSDFEKRRLTELAQRLPDLAVPIQAVIERLVDLLPITRKHYYHPAMCGSWSLKAVLPTVAPDLGYDGLAVSNGLMAQEVFREVMDPTTKVRQRNLLRRQLIEYCGQDTLALVRLAHFFEASAEIFTQTSE